MATPDTTRLERLNNQQAAIDTVLASQDPGKQVFVVFGPPGAGVSWTLDRCAVLWTERGGAALQARGEACAADRELFPWLTMVLPGAKHLARLELLKGTVAHGTKAVPLVGSLTSYLVEEVLNHKKRLLSRQARLLSAPEQDLLFVIQNSAKRKRLLLTIDHLDVWDSASWSLLALICSSQLDELYPAVATAIIVVGATGEVPARLHEIVKTRPTELSIRLPCLEELPTVLTSLGFPDMAERDATLLYGVTMGRLDLLHDVATYLREERLESLAASWSEFYATLIQRRLKDLGHSVPGLEGILAAAAVIGQTFTMSDITCLMGSTSDALSPILRLAASERFLSAAGDIARFESAELHRYFHSAGTGNHAHYHAKFAECLRVMRPGDYGHRTSHLLLSGNAEDALTCFALATLEARRQYRPLPEPGSLRNAAAWAPIHKYLDRMLEAFDAYDDQRIKDGLRIVEAIEAFVPDVLAAERDYMEAVLLLAEPSVASYDAARRLLERWRTLAGRERGIWARIAQSLIVAQAQTGHLEEARELEAQLTRDYWSRRHVDPWVLHALNVLRRRAECLHSLPASAQRLENAVGYFGPTADETLPRHPVQYYYSLTNLVGNQLASGRFDRACELAMQLEELIRAHGSVSWPLPEIAANNSVLARFLSGAMDPLTAATLLAKLTSGLLEAGDLLLLHNNCAVLLIKAGRVPEGKAALDATYRALLASAQPDGYHRYFVANNLAALAAMAGDMKRARGFLDECEGVLDQFCPAIHTTMVRRQELAVGVMEQAHGLTPDLFDLSLIRHHGIQVGPQWAFYGRGFLLSDIQFWSAD